MTRPAPFVSARQLIDKNSSRDRRDSGIAEYDEQRTQALTPQLRFGRGRIDGRTWSWSHDFPCAAVRRRLVSASRYGREMAQIFACRSFEGRRLGGAAR